MAISDSVIKALSVATMTAFALLLSAPAFAWHGGGGGFHGGGFHGGGMGRGFGGGGFGRGFGGGGLNAMHAMPGGAMGGRYGHWHNGYWRHGRWYNGGWGYGGYGWGGWGYPDYGWGWGYDPGWWDGDYYYAAPVYTQCYIRRVHVHTRHGWRWRRVRYCYQ